MTLNQDCATTEKTRQARVPGKVHAADLMAAVSILVKKMIT
jgi:hypothetical protein